MHRHFRTALVFATSIACLLPGVAAAQDAPTGDPVIQRIYQEGMQRSHASQLAEVLMDSIGPRLMGSPQNRAANDWLVKTYQSWGISAKNEQYGTWRDWKRGQSRVELLAPRARTLEATMLAWSAPTPRAGVSGEVVIIPSASVTKDSAGFNRWLGTVKGKIVMISFPQPTCRPDSSWARWATEDWFTAMRAERDTAMTEWRQRLTATGLNSRTIAPKLDAAGAVAILTNTWSRGWGVDKIFLARSEKTPTFDVSCEDYSLLARLASNNQHPTVRVFAEAELAPKESPVYNTVATVPGSSLPNEYVMLSAHLDSWDGGSGATDNGTGTIVMLEAMRILHAAYPHPKRTIIAGHWSGEEEGDIGSAAYAADHPDVIKGMQVLLNQDNGTGEIDTVRSVGFLDAPASFASWMSRMPGDVTRGVYVDFPGFAHDESTDSDAFACRDAPAFFLNSSDWDYNDYTWHTNRDTYDKISWAAVEKNATLIAMLAYEASEDPQKVSRARRVPPPDHAPPKCDTPPRSWAEVLRGAH
ncbi:MAG: M28 family peptidase [Gemmatimonadaceae bacterium]